MVTLSAAYSATLFSSLAVRTYPLPFQDLEGLIRTGSKLAIPAASAQLDYFKVCLRAAQANDVVCADICDMMLLRQGCRIYYDVLVYTAKPVLNDR